MRNYFEDSFPYPSGEPGVISGTEFTGLIPSAPESDEELENEESINRFFPDERIIPESPEQDMLN